MSYASEFQTIDLILGSNAPTRGVDAFALALIKAERQIRRLVTHLVYQFPCFTGADIGRLREALWENRQVYFQGFERGFDALYRHSIKDLIGTEYDRLRRRIEGAIDHRNKLFHGQLTLQSLTRDDLLAFVSDLKSWCGGLAEAAHNEFQFDGFSDSFIKSPVADLSTRFRIQLASIPAYTDFIRQHMQRR